MKTKLLATKGHLARGGILNLQSSESRHNGAVKGGINKQRAERMKKWEPPVLNWGKKS